MLEQWLFWVPLGAVLLFFAMIVVFNILSRFVRSIGLMACRIGNHTVGRRTESSAVCRWCGRKGAVDNQGRFL